MKSFRNPLSTKSSKTILIIGASARAAAFSAIRAGLRPIAMDLFNDWDLAQSCQAVAIEDYPRESVEMAAQFPGIPWMYCGGFENVPNLVAKISETHPLWGNASETLRRIRNPFHLTKTLQNDGFHVPTIREIPPRKSERIWLIKRLHSSGGTGICVYNPAESTTAVDDRYFQEFIRGTSISVLFVAARGQARLLGITKQLHGQQWGVASDFPYVGSIGPFVLDKEQRSRIQELGTFLAATFPLRGLFGVDAILNQHGFWPVDVNPRFPASSEILERVFDFNALAVHVAACQTGQLPSEVKPQTSRCHGKAIVFAEETCVVSNVLRKPCSAVHKPNIWPQIADIPRAGVCQQRGDPIMTVFATGPNVETVEQQLMKCVATTRQQLLKLVESPH